MRSGLETFGEVEIVDETNEGMKKREQAHPKL